MRLLLLPGLQIVNDDNNVVIGDARFVNGQSGPLRVSASVTPDDRGSVEVATVNSFDQCLTALADHYDKNPPRWDCRSAAWYVKETPHSTLRVDQGPRGEWRVYRDDYPLLEDTKPATFRSREEAQCVADAHLMDDYPGAAPAIEDGFSWLFDPELHWRSVPHLVEGRAHWKPLAILSRP